MNLLNKATTLFFLLSPTINLSCETFTLYPKTKEIQGRALLSYINDVCHLDDSDEKFLGHSNIWESREIAQIFNRLGYIVDYIHYCDLDFTPTLNYDVCFDIHYNLQRLHPTLNKDCIKILHITTCHPHKIIQESIKRIDQLKKKKPIQKYYIERIHRPDLFLKSLECADYCSLIGNEITLSTFHPEDRNKITKVTVSASYLGENIKKENYVPAQKEFLWFFGSGALHKGLDLVLDVFKKNKNFKLNVIGDVKGQPAFWQLYKSELTEYENIKYNGFVKPSGEQFKEIIDKCFCFIAPSCSESISTAVATCLQVGLFPILSKNTGIDLPINCGIYLNELSEEEIEKAINISHNISSENLESQIKLCQEMAFNFYSRESFSKSMTNFLKKALKL